MTKTKMGGNGRNECSDAFRHAFYNAINTYSCGSNIAKVFGDAHECFPDSDKLSEKDMDLFNNSVGRNVALNNPDLTHVELANLICNKLENGELKMLENKNNGNSSLINTSNCNCL